MERLTNKDHKELGFCAYVGAQNPFKTPQTIVELAGCLNSPRKILEDILNLLAAYEDALSLERAQELAQAEKDGRLVVLRDGITVHDLQNEYCKAKHMADERLPSPDYTTGRIAGFGEGAIHILDKILTREEAEEALKKREADNETD